MRFVHSADIHLGFTAYARESSGQNSRGLDICSAFESLVAATISAKADALIIAGDLFHGIRPAFRTLSFCMQQIGRLKDASITVFISGGNHDTPKTAGVSSPLEALEFFDNVTCAYDAPKSVPCGDAVFHLMPYRFKKDTLWAEIESIAPEPTKYNVLVLHCAVDLLKTMQYDEVLLSMDEIKKIRSRFDYVAMGHFHGQTADYSGSLEKLTFNEKGDKKGYIIVETPAGKIEHIEMPTRPMLDLPPLDLAASSTPTSDILTALRNAGDIKGKIVRLKVINVPALTYRAIDFRELRKATERAFNSGDVFVFDIKEERGNYTTDRAAFKTIGEEWKDYATEKKLGDAVAEVGTEYIKRGEDEE